MGKTIHFLTGLPRSGSTLLANILNQNPKFHATETSGILGIVVQARNTWNQSTELIASNNPESKANALKGLFEGYHSVHEEDIVFDKSRGWSGYVELGREISPDGKFIVTVRDMADILSSFEKLFRKNAGKDAFPQEKQFPIDWITLEGRLRIMCAKEQPVGIAYNRLKDAFARGYRDLLHIVEFEDLTNEPEKTLKSIYEFIGEEYFEHDFDNVDQSTDENDTMHGIEGLHDIRPKVEPVKSDARKILGKDLYNQYSNQEFWR